MSDITFTTSYNTVNIDTCIQKYNIANRSLPVNKHCIIFSEFPKLNYCSDFFLSTQDTYIQHTVYREKFAPILFSTLWPSLTAGEFKMGNFQCPKLYL